MTDDVRNSLGLHIIPPLLSDEQDKILEEGGFVTVTDYDGTTTLSYCHQLDAEGRGILMIRGEERVGLFNADCVRMLIAVAGNSLPDGDPMKRALASYLPTPSAPRSWPIVRAGVDSPTPVIALARIAPLREVVAPDLPRGESVKPDSIVCEVASESEDWRAATAADMFPSAVMREFRWRWKE